MELDRTPHGRVIMVVAAYVIGLTTMYLALSASPTEPKAQDSSVATTPDPTPSQVTQQNTYPRTEHSADGFYVIMAAEHKVLLSVNAAVTEQTAGLTFGIHSDIPADAISLDGRYVYYCEQLPAVTADCSSFVYDTMNSVIYRVRAAEQLIESDATTVSAAWDALGKLRVDNYYSISNETPWLVASVAQ